MDDFKFNISAGISSINERLNSHEQRLDNNEDDINRLRYANDLRLTGIPHVQNENLVQIYQTLSAICENLTKKNATIFKLAQNMRSDKRIAQVFTMDGLVKIKFVKGINQRIFTIRSIAELKNLVEQHNPNAMDIATNTDAQSICHETDNQTPLNNNVQPHIQAALNSIAQSQPTNIAHPITHTNIINQHLNSSIELLASEDQQQHTMHTSTCHNRQQLLHSHNSNNSTLINQHQQQHQPNIQLIQLHQHNDNQHAQIHGEFNQYFF